MIVVMDEDLDGSLMHKIRLGKGERLPHQSPHSLADRVVVAFNVVCFAAPLAAVVLSSRHHLSISRPKIAVAEAAFVSGRDALPQHAISSNSNSSPAWAGTRVALKAGKLRDFFLTTKSLSGAIHQKCAAAREDWCARDRRVESLLCASRRKRHVAGSRATCEGTSDTCNAVCH